MNVRLRYFVRVTITRSYNTVVKEQDFAVQNAVQVGFYWCMHQHTSSVSQQQCATTCDAIPLVTIFLQNTTVAVVNEAPVQGIKMEVGIEDCLHIEFEFDKQKYHLKVRNTTCFDVHY
jgi:vacuolar protein sorting-associated protein 26